MRCSLKDACRITPRFVPTSRPRFTSCARVWLNQVDVLPRLSVEYGLATDLSTIADNLAGYLRARSGVSQVQVRLSAAARQGKKRLPVPRLFTKQGAAF